MCTERILSKLVKAYSNHSHYSNGQCGEFAFATVILLDHFGYYSSLCTSYDDDNSKENPVHSFIYCDGWFFDHEHLTQSEVEFFELDENLLDPDGFYEGEDYPNLEMDQDFEYFFWDVQNYVCFCWECIETLLKEFEEIFSIKIKHDIIEKYQREYNNYVLSTQ